MLFQTPFGITKFGESLYVSDWGRHAILKISQDGTQESVVMDDLDGPMGLFY